MKHAASVRPEPGSNSPLSEKFMSIIMLPKKHNCSTCFYLSVSFYYKINRYIFVFSYSVFKVQFFLGTAKRTITFLFPFLKNLLSFLATSFRLSLQNFVSTISLKNLNLFFTVFVTSSRLSRPVLLSTLF